MKNDIRSKNESYSFCFDSQYGSTNFRSPQFDNLCSQSGTDFLTGKIPDITPRNSPKMTKESQLKWHGRSMSPKKILNIAPEA